MTIEELTAKEAAARLNVADVTVRLWCRQGRFPNARAVDTPRGAIWYIPAGDLKDFQHPQPGRPPKSSPTTEKRATGHQRAGNGTATAAPQPQKARGGQDGKVVFTKKGGKK